MKVVQGYTDDSWAAGGVCLENNLDVCPSSETRWR